MGLETVVDCCITLDVDWAPDWCIEMVAGFLQEKGVKATWFLTHLSPRIERCLCNNDLFETGIHPNFLPGSTQGASPEEVMRHLKGLVPGAVSVRTHALVQSTPLLRMMREDFGMLYESSLFMPLVPGLRPHTLFLSESGKGLVRVPCFWIDNIEMYGLSTGFTLAHQSYHVGGLKVFVFHPIHLVLNSGSMATYEELKRRGRPMEALEPGDVLGLRNEGKGTDSLFCEIVELLSVTGGGRTVREIGRGALSDPGGKG